MANKAFKVAMVKYGKFEKKLLMKLISTESLIYNLYL